MEVFVDFGLFELLAAAGLFFVSRKIYASRRLGLLFLVLSLAAPAVLVFVGHEGPVRWVAVVCLATSLVNAALIFSLIQRRVMATLLIDQQISPPIKGSS
jgi:hypothetical protein